MKRFWLIAAIMATGCAFGALPGYAQTSYTSNSETGAWNTSRWNNSADGPTYSSAYTANNNVSFTSGSYSFAGMGAVVNVGNVTVADNVSVTFASTSNTFATNGAVRTFTIGNGGLFNFNGQTMSSATNAGFNKAGAGTLNMGAGNTFAGGFTVNAGTVIAGGVNAMGAGGSLNLNGGILSVNNGTNRDFTGKYSGGISVGGNIQFGDSVGVAAGTGNMTFTDNMALGASPRMLTLGSASNILFGGVISNTAGNAITFAATSGGTGRFEITNAANTFTGDIAITGGEVRFTSDGSLGNAANDIIIDGGRLATASPATFTLGAGRDIFVGDGAGTSISNDSGTLTINNAIQNKASEAGSWAKLGSGTLELGGVSSYSGSTAINHGTLKLNGGNDRLPTGTTVSLGQAASANLGTFDLSGRNQQIAGLNSTSGTNATSSNNTVTSTAAATLTLGGSGTYSYGDGTNANSGVISGAIALVKSGSGTQILGDANTYSGGTTINSGKLVVASKGSISHSLSNFLLNAGLAEINGTVLANGTAVGTGSGSGARIGGTGTVSGGLTIAADGTLGPGNSQGTFTSDGNLVINGNYEWEVDTLLTPKADLTIVNGDLDWNGTLQMLVGSGAPSIGEIYSLFAYNGSLLGSSFTNPAGYVISVDQTSGGLNAGGVPGGYKYINISAVPEPTSGLLLAAGGIGLVAVRRRRQTA